MKWKTLESKIGFSDKWLTYRIDTCQMPNGKIVAPYYVLEYPDWAAALALTEDKEVILVRQYRHGYGKTVLELPGGIIEPQEDIEEAIRRELQEETGYVFDEVVNTSVVAPNPSNQSNLFHGFLALGGKKVSAPNLDNTEDIQVELCSLDQFQAMLDNNELIQAMHVSAAYYALKALKRL